VSPRFADGLPWYSRARAAGSLPASLPTDGCPHDVGCATPGALSSHRLRKTHPADGRPRPAISVPVATLSGPPPAYYSSPPSQPVPSATSQGHRRRAHPPECRYHGGPMPVSPSAPSPHKSTPPSPVLHLDLSRHDIVSGHHRIDWPPAWEPPGSVPPLFWLLGHQLGISRPIGWT
jgi:hypothetical protein